MSVDSSLLAIKTLFRAPVDDDRPWRLGLELDGEQFQVEVDRRGLKVRRGRSGEPDVVFTGPAGVLLDIVRHRCELDDVVRGGRADVDGDLARFRGFISSFDPDSTSAGTAEQSR